MAVKRGLRIFLERSQSVRYYQTLREPGFCDVTLYFAVRPRADVDRTYKPHPDRRRYGLDCASIGRVPADTARVTNNRRTRQPRSDLL